MDWIYNTWLEGIVYLHTTYGSNGLTVFAALVLISVLIFVGFTAWEIVYDIMDLIAEKKAEKEPCPRKCVDALYGRVDCGNCRG